MLEMRVRGLIRARPDCGKPGAIWDQGLSISASPPERTGLSVQVLSRLGISELSRAVADSQCPFAGPRLEDPSSVLLVMCRGPGFSDGLWLITRLCELNEILQGSGSW